MEQLRARMYFEQLNESTLIYFVLILCGFFPSEYVTISNLIDLST